MEQLNKFLLNAIKADNREEAESLVFQGANPYYVLQEACGRLYEDTWNNRSSEESLKLETLQGNYSKIKLNPSQISLLVGLSGIISINDKPVDDASREEICSFMGTIPVSVLSDEEFKKDVYSRAMEYKAEGNIEEYLIRLAQANDLNVPEAFPEYNSLSLNNLRKLDFGPYSYYLKNFWSPLGYIDHLIAAIYLLGFGIDINVSMAYKYVLKATSKDNMFAYSVLAYLYLKGLGVERDPEKSFNHYLLSSNRGSAGGAFNVGVFYDNGDVVKQNYEKAIEFYELGAKRGSPHAINALGSAYENGRGVSVDLEKAKEYFEQAIEKGDVQSMLNLGVLYFNEFKDKVMAEKYYIMAAEKGDAKAARNLGFNFSGSDKLKAVKYSVMALENGYTPRKEVEDRIKRIDPDGILQKIVKKQFENELLRQKITKLQFLYDNLYYSPVPGPGSRS